MNPYRARHLITDAIAQRVLRLGLMIACLWFPLTGYAATYFVGTCKPGTADFATIQEAVTTVPPGSTIDICPGNYPEWVNISQPLTLQGVRTGDSAAVTITVPSGGPGVYVDGTPAQVLVENPSGPVNLTGIVVDGTGFPTNLANETRAAGIFYSGASGTIDHVTVQNLDQNFSPPPNPPVGIIGISVGDDDPFALQTVAIKNSLVSFPANRSIPELGIAVSGKIDLNITNTSLSLITPPLSETTGIFAASSGTSTISNNRISGSNIGISSFSGTFSIMGNTVIGGVVGIWDTFTTSATITGNTLLGLKGMILSGGETVKNNQIYGLPLVPVFDLTQTTGIDFSCVSPTAVSGNTFVGLTQALVDVPSGISLKTTAGNYFGVKTIEQICP